MIRGAPACHNWPSTFRDVDKSQLLCMFLKCLCAVLMGRQWDSSQVFSEDNRGFHVSEELWVIFTFVKGGQREIQERNVFHALQTSEGSETNKFKRKFKILGFSLGWIWKCAGRTGWEGWTQGTPKTSQNRTDKDAIEAKLDGSEQHGTFTQETKAGFSYVDCLEEVAFLDLNHSHESNLVP